MLDMYKLESGKLEFFFSKLDINDIFEHQPMGFLDKIPNGVEFIIETPPDNKLLIVFDRYSITQELNHFISNACKFT